VPLVSLVAWLLVWKLVATALSTGSGALGGIFTPNLVVGAVFGWFFGHVVHSLTQSTEDPRRAFAFVGLAGLCAATTHAPISSVLLVLEFTHDYGLILPVMLCSIVGSVVSSLLDEDSVYTARLRAKGHAVHGGVEQLAMQSTYVRDIMRKDAERLVSTTGFEQIMDVFGRSRRNSIYVVDAEGRLEGLIHIHDVKNFINDPSLDSVVIAGDLTRPTAGATPDQSLAQVALRFDDPELDELPVVASANGRTLLGRITRSDLVGRLSSEVLTKRNLRSRWRSSEGGEVGTYELPAGAEIARLTLPDALVGHTVESADFGKFGLVLLVVTKPVEDGPDESVVAEPLVPLEAGARLLVLGKKQAIEEFQRQHGM
jgi:CIC family chloride channel protein